MLAVTILGSNSAVPAFGRHPTSQLISTPYRNFLVDCGEGTQRQLIQYKIRRSKISHIFISHLHGDHYFGLIGLINSFALLGRVQELHLIGPAALKEVIDLQLRVADTRLGFELHFHPITQTGFLMNADNIEISCFKTNHRIECYGFSFKEIHNPRKINAEKVKQYQIPYASYPGLQRGLDYKDDKGNLIKNEELTFKAPRGRMYAFCADTKYDESLLPFLLGADAIYHETTYLDAMAERATLRFHSTTKQAGRIAKKAGVKKLLIGHFSSKYELLDEFLSETREVFPNTDLALEGTTFLI